MLKKRIFTVALSIVCCFLLVKPVFAEPISSVYLSKKSVQISTTDSPNELTRAELCRFLVDSFSLFDEEAQVNLPDVPQDHPYYQDIASTIYAGLLIPYPDGYFRPDGYVSRAEFAVVLIINLGYPYSNHTSPIRDVQPSDWFSGPVHTAIDVGLMSLYEDATFRPNSKMLLDINSKLIAKINPTNAKNKKVIWTSSDTNIATVDQTGQVRGITPGQAVITARSIDASKIDTCIVTVAGGTKPGNGSFADWPEKVDVPIDKVWTISFSMPLNEFTVNNRGIYIEHSTGRTIETAFKLSSDKRKVMVTALSNYDREQQYYLYISNKVRSDSDMRLSNPVRMKFTTK